MLAIIGMGPMGEAPATSQQHASRFKEALQVHLAGVYANFLEGEEGRSGATNAFSPEHYRRLAEIKAKYDPDRLFDFSYDIPPAE